jgi:hypothetical protein
MIKERRFADIWTADNRDQRKWLLFTQRIFFS